MMAAAATRIKMHTKALQSPYMLPGGVAGPFRLAIPAEYVPWDVAAPLYDPPEYDDPSILADPIAKKPKPAWADPLDTMTIDFADALHVSVDGTLPALKKTIDPVYKRVVGMYPLNPVGRTGLKGRGLLGRWGPNKAADPIVTRFKGDEVDERGRRVVQFVAIKRRDNGLWAIPGGMVDPGEHVSLTLKREFGEEALSTLELAPAARMCIAAQIESLFDETSPDNQLNLLYEGYVDDPRNTDNAWMETTVRHYHRAQLDLPLSAGDDAGAVAWVDITDDMSHLYADHGHFVRIARARAWYLASRAKFYKAHNEEFVRAAEARALSVNPDDGVHSWTLAEFPYFVPAFFQDWEQ